MENRSRVVVPTQILLMGRCPEGSADVAHDADAMAHYGTCRGCCFEPTLCQRPCRAARADARAPPPLLASEAYLRGTLHVLRALDGSRGAAQRCDVAAAWCVSGRNTDVFALPACV